MFVTVWCPQTSRWLEVASQQSCKKRAYVWSPLQSSWQETEINPSVKFWFYQHCWIVYAGSGIILPHIRICTWAQRKKSIYTWTLMRTSSWLWLLSKRPSHRWPFSSRHCPCTYVFGEEQIFSHWS
jgi:hypothetical protein